jgi:hypothetical protein
MFLGETPSTGSSAPPGDVRFYPRVCLHERYAPRDRFSPAEKTSVAGNSALELTPTTTEPHQPIRQP